MQRLGLRITIVAVALSALGGVYALLAGDVGEFEGKILLTTVFVAGASILAMACGMAWERRRLGLIPPAGVAASVLGFGLFDVAVWTESDAAALTKIIGTLLLVGTAAAHASLLSLTRLPSRHRWVMTSAFVSSLVLVGLLMSAIWVEPEGQGIWRVTGVFAILVAAFTIAAPVLQRISRLESSPSPLVRFCPGCGSALSEPSGGVACAACGVRFRIEFER